MKRCATQIVYYDGQFDDSRLNVSLACTAALAGAAVLNYAEVTELLKVCSRPCLASHACISCSGDMHKHTLSFPLSDVSLLHLSDRFTGRCESPLKALLDDASVKVESSRSVQAVHDVCHKWRCVGAG